MGQRKTEVQILATGGPRVVARVQIVVESADGTETLSLGEGALDLQMVSLMPPTEYAVRHLWPAFLEGCRSANVHLPKLYEQPIVSPAQS